MRHKVTSIYRHHITGLNRILFLLSIITILFEFAEQYFQKIQYHSRGHSFTIFLNIFTPWRRLIHVFWGDILLMMILSITKRFVFTPPPLHANETRDSAPNDDTWVVFMNCDLMFIFSDMRMYNFWFLWLLSYSPPPPPLTTNTPSTIKFETPTSIMAFEDFKQGNLVHVN